MRLLLHKKFEKKYLKTPQLIRRRFKERRDLFVISPENPILNTHPLSGNRKGQWSINVTGDWRAIYVFQDEQTIIFIDLDTHSNLYK